MLLKLTITQATRSARYNCMGNKYFGAGASAHSSGDDGGAMSTCLFVLWKIPPMTMIHATWSDTPNTTTSAQLQLLTIGLIGN